MIPWKKLCQKNNFFPRKYGIYMNQVFPDAGRCKVITPKGKVANKITSQAGRDNITVLPACNASGKAIDP